MNGILPDINFQGQFARLLYVLNAPDWRGEWVRLRLATPTFRSLGLDQKTPDRLVFERCQQLGMYLITANRNHDGPDSLEATLRDAGPLALPVFTLGNGQRVLEEPAFATAVALHLLEYAIDVERDPTALLGSGRIYLPKTGG